MTVVYQKILALLDSHVITYDSQHHEPTPTSEDSARVRGVTMHAGAKALVMQGKKSGTHMLCVIPADLRFSAKKFAEHAGERVSFAKDPEAVTGCVPGSVPPLGSVIGLRTY